MAFRHTHDPVGLDPLTYLLHKESLSTAAGAGDGNHKRCFDLVRMEMRDAREKVWVWVCFNEMNEVGGKEKRERKKKRNEREKCEILRKGSGREGERER